MAAFIPLGVMTYDPRYHTDEFNQAAFTHIMQLIDKEGDTSSPNYCSWLLGRLSLFYPDCSACRFMVELKEDLDENDEEMFFAEETGLAYR